MAKNVIERILFFIFLSINAIVNLNYWKSTNNFEKRINFDRYNFKRVTKYLVYIVKSVFQLIQNI